MKQQIILIFLILISNFMIAQDTEELSYAIDYIGTYKMYPQVEESSQELFRLMKRQDSSVFQSINNMRADTVKKRVMATRIMEKMPRSNHDYTINYYKDSLVFRGEIYMKNYVYQEKLNFNWNYLPETKTISGHVCKLATTEYGGRLWSAWYAIDIPLDAGPYKFKGLPGLIMECYDEEQNYKWEFQILYKGKKTFNFQRYYSITPLEDYIKISRDEFLTLRFKINNSSQKELNESGITGYKTWSPERDDESRLREQRLADANKKYIPIELPEKN